MNEYQTSAHRASTETEGINKNVKLIKMRDALQEHMVQKYSKAINTENFSEETYKSYIEQYIIQRKWSYQGMTTAQLVNFFYSELKEYSVITPYLDDPNIEEININSWEDIKLHYSDGRIIQAPRHFDSPTNALDNINKMLRKQKFGNRLDSESPIVRGHLGKDKRITSGISPIIDSDRGVFANIRMINPKKMKKQDFIDKGTANEEIYDFLLGCFKCKLSSVFIGETNAGKTTIMSSFLDLIDNEKRLITIENEVREFDLIKRDRDGRIINSVIHEVTTKRYNQEQLLEYALTSNPDYICLAEMKSAEAFDVTEACRTGHTVTTTIHAKSCRAAYTRMATLCLLKGMDIDYNIIHQLCIESFPIAVMMKKLDDNSRKIVEITEAYLDDNLNPVINTIYRYKNTNRYIDENGKVKLEGEFIKVNDISDRLKQEFVEMGYDISFLEPKIKEIPKKVVKKPLPAKTERTERPTRPAREKKESVGA